MLKYCIKMHNAGIASRNPPLLPFGIDLRQKRGLPSYGDHLGRDGDGDFLGSLGAYIEADGRAQRLGFFAVGSLCDEFFDEHAGLASRADKAGIAVFLAEHGSRAFEVAEMTGLTMTT